MANTPMTAAPIRKLSPLDMGGVLLDGQGPYAMQQAKEQQALMAQQQMMEQQQQAEQPPPAEEQMLEQLKAEKDGLTKTNKVKELALAIEDEIRKQAELDERIAQNPSAAGRLAKLLKEYGLI
ncbi:MAG: hypothetical protein EOM68_11935 [Spirochaetia bacterium]|nr:hypothetical protein [Spirochaetia bacterium]